MGTKQCHGEGAAVSLSYSQSPGSPGPLPTWGSTLSQPELQPISCKEIKPVNPKGNQSWIFIEGADAEAPILWSPDAKSQLIGKDTDAGKDWGQEVTQDEMIGWHHWLNGHEFEQTQGDSEGQGSLVCCSPWGCKEWDMTEQLNSEYILVFTYSHEFILFFPKLPFLSHIEISSR